MNDTPRDQALASARRAEDLEMEAALEGAPCVEHLSVPGFLRRVPSDGPLGMANIIKFGRLVGNLAQGFHVPYQATMERELGVVQAFPEPMMMRAYRYLSPALGWPTIIDARALRPAQPVPPERQVMTPGAELQVRRTMITHLRCWATHAIESDVRGACRVILAMLEQECAALEKQLGREQSGE